MNKVLRRTPIALAFAVAWGLMPPAALAQQEATMPEVIIHGEQESDSGFTAKRAASTTKSDATLLETPQSITVITRGLLDSMQANTMAEALRSVAGVVPGHFGRRGFDDFIIRGQRASESIYVDGLRTAQSVQLQEETFAAERLEVLKGPASLLFGNVQPGGMVNVVSKRPRRDPFLEAGVTVGNEGYKQATVDVGRPLSDSGRAAFRINALAMNSGDPTDFVFFKTRWIAPSLSLDLGTATSLTLLASRHERQWLRQQGLSPRGTILPNPNGPIPLNRFIGETANGAYDVERSRIGYAFEHRFASGWTLHQNFRWEEYDGLGPGVFNGSLQANGRLQNRTVSNRDFEGRLMAIDTYLNGAVEAMGALHKLSFGVDRNTPRERFAITQCTLAALDLYQPVYGAPIKCPAQAQSDTTSRTPLTGVYLRDRVALGERLGLTLGVRRDRATTSTANNKTGVVISKTDLATSGTAGLTYEIAPGIAGYASYANSFLPVTGTDFSGASFNPETGRQAEVGVKFQRDGGRVSATLAAYDLRRRNVTTADPVNNGFSVQTGEERSQGVEAELAMDLRNGWNVQGAYAYTAAEVSRDNRPANLGKPLNNVPRHSASVWANHLVRDGALKGLGFGIGLRHESDKRGFSFDYTVAGYTVADASVSYVGSGYRLALNVKNLFDKTYFAGGLNNNVVTLGDPRQLRLNAVFDF